MPKSVSRHELFTLAYQGKIKEAGMLQFHDRLRQRAILLRYFEFVPVPPCHQYALRWLKAHVPKGSRIFEIGIGMGLFLHTCRLEGFEATGLDIAKPVANLLRKEGFLVWDGPTETLPNSWPKPVAVLSFFVLHHIADPVNFIFSIREHFPSCPLILAEYHRDNLAVDVSLKDPAPFPPRTLTWWNEESVRCLLERAGYEVQTTLLVEATPVGILGRKILRSARAIGLLLNLQPAYPIYVRLVRVLSHLSRNIWRARRKSMAIGSFLVIAVPRNTTSPSESIIELSS